MAGVCVASGACPGGGGGKGACPPSLEIEKPKKRKKVIRAILSYFTYIFLLFL